MPSGTFTMNNSRGEECLIAHAQIRQTTEWNIISYVTLSELEGTQVDWPLIIPVGAALLLLFLLDMAYMMKFNRRLAHVARDSYDLVFMDIQMPVMNGLDAARAIRALENSWACDIPIIAMTADAFSENVSECMAAGMNGHIAKPIDTKQE